MTRWLSRITLLSLVVGNLAACAMATPPAADPLAAMRNDKGQVVWQQEYAFVPPPAPWQLLDLDENDYSIAFFRSCADLYPCDASMAYAEEPFGYSRDFNQRQEEFFQRFLWAARVVFDQPELTPTTALGAPALEAVVIGSEPVLKHKVLTRVIFARRGERVVAFYLSQWRPEDQPFDRSVFADQDAFIASFEYLRPSFFQQLYPKGLRLKKAAGGLPAAFFSSFSWSARDHTWIERFSASIRSTTQ